ncbi:MAG: GIY-YIG nuclease family protein [bacterium]|jgi:hypothetical protein
MNQLVHVTPDTHPSLIDIDDKRGWVYCIRDHVAEAVKIGFSADPHRRLMQLQTGSAGRLHLVGAVFTARKAEKHLHWTFEDLNIGGEWFADQSGALTAELRKAFLGDESTFNAWLVLQLRKSAQARLEHADALEAEALQESAA